MLVFWLMKEEIIQKTAAYIKEKLAGEGSGHDWWHIYRVWKNAQHIGKQEGADMFVVELAALLHDVADWKFNDGDEMLGSKVAKEWLLSLKVDNEIIDQVYDIIAATSFKGAGVKSEMKSTEGKVVQDSDRLDAIGAIGISRAFAYGGFKNREIHNPASQPAHHNTFKEYQSNQSTTINHFYEKLMLLKDLMNTKTGRKLAEQRHKYMEEFLEEFYLEWEGKK